MRKSNWEEEIAKEEASPMREQERRRAHIPREPFKRLVLCLWQCSEDSTHYGWRLDNALRGTCDACLAMTCFEADVLVLDVETPKDMKRSDWVETQGDRAAKIAQAIRELKGD
jgi:hypothetical protein